MACKLLKYRSAILNLTFTFTIFLMLGTLTSAHAATLLLFSEVSSENAVPRNSSVHDALISEMVIEFQSMGFQVVTNKSLAGAVNSASAAYPVSDTIFLSTLADRMLSSPDYALLYSLFVRAENNGNTRIVKSTMAGRLLNVNSQKRIGIFEVIFPHNQIVSADCYRDCLLKVADEQIAELVNVLAKDVAAKLKNTSNELAVLDSSVSTQIDIPSNTIPSNTIQSDSFSLVFRGFTSDEIDLVLRFIPSFKGHISTVLMEQAGNTSIFQLKINLNGDGLVKKLNLLMQHLALLSSVDLTDGKIVLARGNLVIE